MSSNEHLSEKVVLITGSSSGVGARTAQMMAQLGAKLVISGRDEQRIAEVADRCKSLSPFSFDPLRVTCDLTDSAHIKSLVVSTVDAFGRIDILVANAGIVANSLIDNPNLMEAFDRSMLTNVRPTLRLIQLCVPYLLRTKGNIVVTSSIFSFKPVSSLMPYCMAKASLDVMTKCLALDLAPKGVRVNSVNPGLIKDNHLTSSLVDFDQINEQLFNNSVTNPSKRLVEVDDIAKAIIHLATNDTLFTTGVNFCIDGDSSLEANISF